MTDILKVKQNGVWVAIPALKGEPGAGLASGGTEGQFLVKKTNANFDTEWKSFNNLLYYEEIE